MLNSKSGTNEHPTRPFELRICGFFSWPSPPSFFAFKPPNYRLQTQLKSKSGMNGHPIRPFRTIIELPDSPMNKGGFYAFKPCNYGLQT